MTSQVLRNNEIAVMAVKRAYFQRKITREQTEWLLSGIKI